MPTAGNVGEERLRQRAEQSRLQVGDRDIVLVIDFSRSTVDRWQPPQASQPVSSFLAEQLRAARVFLDSVDPQGAAVGLVGFSGGAPRSDWRNPRGESSAAWTEAPLSTDFAELERILDQLNQRVPDGATHLAAAIDQGIIELLALRGARSTPRLGALPALVILTDGLPTLPYGPGWERKNFDAARRALDRARRAEIACFVLGLGPDAGGIGSLVDAVEATGGALTIVDDPGRLAPVISRVAEWLSPRRPLPPTSDDSEDLLLVLAGGRWGYPAATGGEGADCSGNPHSIEVADDRLTLVVRYAHPIDRGDGSEISERRYRVVERRSNFVRLVAEDGTSAGSGVPQYEVFRIHRDSYCIGWSDRCAERCR